MVWYKPWRWHREYINRNKQREVDSFVDDFFSLEHRLCVIGKYNAEGEKIPGRMQDIRTKINAILLSMGPDAPADPIDVIYERRRSNSSLSSSSGSSGDSAFERRCQEIAGQRYSASEICGGPDTAYEQAQREAKFAEDLRNMNY